MKRDIKVRRVNVCTQEGRVCVKMISLMALYSIKHLSCCLRDSLEFYTFGALFTLPLSHQSSNI